MATIPHTLVACLLAFGSASLAARSPIGVSTDEGASAVRVFEGGNIDHDFDPFPGFTGGVRVALGDVNADGVADIIVAAGPGAGPHVRVIDGASGLSIHDFFAYDPAFTGGVFVGAGDVDGDRRADLITAPGPGGGPHVRVFSGADGAMLHAFFAYDPSFTGGVHVAGGDYNGDGFADIVTGAGAGAGPHVKVFDGLRLKELANFFAYSPSFTGGVRVASGDVDGDGIADLITGPGAGAAPEVARFLGPDGTDDGRFFAFDASFTGGIFVSGAAFLPVIHRDGFEGAP